VNLPGVGRNLIDHPMVFVVAAPVAGIPHDPQVTNPVGIRYTAKGSDEFNDMQMYVLELFDPNLSPGLALDLPVPSISLVPGLQRPHSRGRLSLRSANPDVPPIIDLNYLADPEDMRRMADAVRIAWRPVRSVDVNYRLVGLRGNGLKRSACYGTTPQDQRERGTMARLHSIFP
jgi:choline dehydrogenase